MIELIQLTLIFKYLHIAAKFENTWLSSSHLDIILDATHESPTDMRGYIVQSKD